MNSSDLAAVLIALIAAIGSVTTAVISVFALRMARATHVLVNSRTTELLEATAGQARAEGMAAGEQAARDRTGPA